MKQLDFHQLCEDQTTISLPSGDILDFTQIGDTGYVDWRKTPGGESLGALSFDLNTKRSLEINLKRLAEDKAYWDEVCPKKGATHYNPRTHNKWLLEAPTSGNLYYLDSDNAWEPYIATPTTRKNHLTGAIKRPKASYIPKPREWCWCNIHGKKKEQTFFHGESLDGKHWICEEVNSHNQHSVWYVAKKDAIFSPLDLDYEQRKKEWVNTAIGIAGAGTNPAECDVTFAGALFDAMVNDTLDKPE